MQLYHACQAAHFFFGSYNSSNDCCFILERVTGEVRAALTALGRARSFPHSLGWQDEPSITARLLLLLLLLPCSLPPSSSPSSHNPSTSIPLPLFKYLSGALIDIPEILKIALLLPELATIGYSRVAIALVASNSKLSIFYAAL